MSTADKLTYLNNTKGLLKDRLNSLGATITSSTTFRNYLTWLDTFYEEVSNKTDIATNGIVGRTSQETTTGKQLFDKNNVNILTGYISGNNFTLTGTGGSNRSLCVSCEPNTTYTIQKEIVDTNRFRVGTSTNIPTSSQSLSNTQSVDTQGSVTLTTGANDNYIIIHFYNTASTTTMSDVLDTIMMEEGSIASQYEKYTGGQPSPSVSYPQSITTLTGNVIYTITGSETKTVIIPLNDIELCEINTYKDSIYSNDSKFYLKKETAKINSYNGETISTDYKSTTGGLDTGATVYYGTTASITEITSSNYPELYVALKEIEDYLTSYKINKEFILGYSSPNIEY